MKAKLAILVLFGLLARLTATAQTNPPAPTALAESRETTSITVTAGATNAPAITGENAVIDFIQLQEATLTSAIENLARQAGINYVIDPNVGYGQPDERGQMRPQPTISIRWEHVTPEQALMALLGNYGLQLVADPKTPIARIMKRDPAAPEPLVTKIIQLKYAGVTNMAVAVQASLTKGKVVADIRTSQLVVIATEREQTEVVKTVERLDTPTRQVLIEARLMEISRNPQTVKGVDWSGTLAAQNFSFGNGNSSAQTVTTTPGTPTTVTLPSGRTITTAPKSTTTTTISGSSGNGGLSLNTLSGFSPAMAFLNADGVHAVLSFLNQDADTTVISTPRTVTLDNETATIAVTRAVPIFKSTAGTQGSPGGSEVLYTNLGTILTVTPRISANNYIWLKLVPEVSSIFRTDTKTVAGQVNQADEYDIRRVETQVLIPSGNTLVMGGLMSDEIKNTYTKVPVLGDLPGIGLAFRSEAKARNKRNLMIFVTPTVVQDSDFQKQANPVAFLKSAPIIPEGGIKPDTAWEGGKARDWSNPNQAGYNDAKFDEKLAGQVNEPSQPQL